MLPLPDLVLRLATDAAFRAAVCATPAATLAPLGVPPAQQRLLAQHRQLAAPSALDALVCDVAQRLAVGADPLSPWLDLLVRAYVACGGRPDKAGTRHALESVLAAFAAAVATLEILDDLADGDAAWGGRQAPHLALALLAVSTALLRRLPRRSGALLEKRWDVLALRCAAAQALDTELSAAPALSVAQALRVAEGSGLVTQWAVEAGALLAGASPALREPLADVGRHLGTAEKLLHDVQELWPGAHAARDLGRPSCNLALVLARDTPAAGAAPGPGEDEARRRQLLASGLLHYAWSCADDYRVQAAVALERFAAAGGDPRPLADLVALWPAPAPSAVVEAEDAEP